MGVNDLTTVTRYKLWFDTPGTNLDDFLAMAITTVSGQILAWLERNSFVSRSYTDIFDGQGTTRQFMENWPVTSVQQVAIGNQIIAEVPAVPSSGSFGNGYRFETWDETIPGGPAQIELMGPVFWRGAQNCSVTYTAGYMLAPEAHTISAGAALTDQPLGIWIGDSGVTHVGGAPFTKVASSPIAGQYALDPTILGKYLFNSADSNTPVLISYSFCPSAVEQVVIEMINEVRSRRGRPGAIARGLAGMETGTYEMQRGIPAWAAVALQPFRSVIPL